MAVKTYGQVQSFTYNGVVYRSDMSLVNQFLRNESGRVVFSLIRASASESHNPLAVVDASDKTLIMNTDIAVDNMGYGGEASRIKCCAGLNTLLDMATEAGWSVVWQSLGLVYCDKSVVDSRAGGTTRPDAGAIFGK